MLPDLGKFVKSDSQRFVVGAIGNQIKTLIQRMKMRGYEPWKILLSPGLRYALRLDCEGKPEWKRTDQGDFFMGLLVKIDKTVEEPIIMIKPEIAKKHETGESTWGKRGSYVSR